MVNDSDRDRLDSLAKRIAAAKKNADPDAGREESDTRVSTKGVVDAIRVGSDFVALVLLPALLGWYLDSKLGTMPLLMLGFLVVGIGLGFWVVIRYLAFTPDKK